MGDTGPYGPIVNQRIFVLYGNHGPGDILGVVRPVCSLHEEDGQSIRGFGIYCIM